MSTLKTNSIQPTTPGSEDYFLARAWINFNGTGVVAIRGDGNVSSITDNGTGDYTLNITKALSSTTYSIVCMVGKLDPAAGEQIGVPYSTATSTTTACRVQTRGGGSGLNDAAFGNFIIMN